MAELDTAAVAGLFADRSRVAMIDLLLDGQDHALSALAHAAGVAPSTAVGHVSLLERGGIVCSRRQGRNRLVRLAGPEVAAAYEALAELAPERRVTSLRGSTRRERLAAARTCYDHLAGRLGVALTDAALEADALTADFGLGPSAGSWFARLGVDSTRSRAAGGRSSASASTGRSAASTSRARSVPPSAARSSTRAGPHGGRGRARSP